MAPPHDTHRCCPCALVTCPHSFEQHDDLIQGQIVAYLGLDLHSQRAQSAA